MDHTEAVRQMAAEKYLLNELAPELRRSFEEHFFVCPECEFDVQAGYALIDGSKAVFSEQPSLQPAPARAPRWMGWLRPALTFAAMAGLAAIIGYQSLITVPRLKSEIASAQTPQAASALYLQADVTRAASEAAVVKGNSPFTLSFDVPWKNTYSSYSYELYSPSGELVWSASLPSETARNTVAVSVYLKRGSSGSYRLTGRGVVSGNPSGQSVAFDPQTFELRIQ